MRQTLFIATLLTVSEASKLRTLRGRAATNTSRALPHADGCFTDMVLVPSVGEIQFRDIESCATDNGRAFMQAELKADVIRGGEVLPKGKHKAFSHPKSFHELVRSPYKDNLEPIGTGIPTLWATQMNSGIVIKIKPQKAQPNFLLAAPQFRQFGPMQIEGLHKAGDTSPTGAELFYADLVQIHQTMIPEHGAQVGLRRHMMYMCAENINSIISWDWKKGKDAVEAVYPIPFEDEVTGWKCCDTTSEESDCTSPDPKKRCPRGNNPHSMAEDSAGNIWVSLKDGAVARLKNPSLITDPRNPLNWYIKKAFSGQHKKATIVFYIQGNQRGDTIWANSYMSNQLLHIADPTAESPTVHIYDIPLPASVAGTGHEGEHSGMQGAFPSGLRVLNNGGVLFTMYRRFGMLGKMEPGGKATFMDIPNSKDAFLHLDFIPSADDSTTFTLWLLASSNAFPVDKKHPGLYSAPTQMDMLVKLDGFNANANGNGSMEYETATKFRVASQHQYLHRVVSLDGGNKAAVTMLLGDKLALVSDSHNGTGAAEQLAQTQTQLGHVLPTGDDRKL